MHGIITPIFPPYRAQCPFIDSFSQPLVPSNYIPVLMLSIPGSDAFCCDYIFALEQMITRETASLYLSSSTRISPTAMKFIRTFLNAPALAAFLWSISPLSPAQHFPGLYSLLITPASTWLMIRLEWPLRLTSTMTSPIEPVPRCDIRITSHC